MAFHRHERDDVIYKEGEPQAPINIERIQRYDLSSTKWDFRQAHITKTFHSASEV